LIFFRKGDSNFFSYLKTSWGANDPRFGSLIRGNQGGKGCENSIVSLKFYAHIIIVPRKIVVKENKQRLRNTALVQFE
jgi:hypothetical protein